MKITHTNVDKKYQETAVKVLQSGGIVVAPSDTVYGLLVDASTEAAVKKLLAFKNRPIGKPISIFLPDFDSVRHHTNISEKQEKLLKKFIPGPFTVILPSRHKVSRLLESEKGTLGVRVIDHPVIKKLLEGFNGPFTATSANISGKKPHHSVEAFLATLSQTKKDLIDLVLDAGQLPRNKPSTVVDLSGSDIKILRKGDVMLSSESSYLSTSPEQTKKIGFHLLKKHLDSSDRPLVFIIEGDLGVGKTILVKGIAEALAITNIISPTFVVYYEYPISLHRHPELVSGSIQSASKIYKYFVHADLYNVQEAEEFQHLGIESYLNGKNIICFEWGERMGDLYKTIQQKADIIYIKMSYKSEDEREISISS